MKAAKLISLFFFTFLVPVSQSFSQNETKYGEMYKSWLIFQVVPSPVIFQDADKDNAKIQFGLRWQVIPLNISFRSNKYTSPVQFFKINPVRRFTGSMDIFLQPEWTLSGYKYAKLARLGIAAGSRIIFPIKGDGEKISMSLGGKYTHRNDLEGGKNGFWGVEAGVYAIFGFVGLQFNYNFDERSRYSVGFYFKYF
jgi:hypothetical protein